MNDMVRTGISRNEGLERRVHSYKEVFEASTAYFNGDKMAASNFMRKYAEKRDGEFLELTPDDMHKRMAREFARVELGYEPQRDNANQDELSEYGRTRTTLTEEKIYGFFKDFKYVVPQGSVMASLGAEENLSSLSNCVVIPPPFDSYGGIMYTDQQLAQLFKRRCGVGVDISTLRPASTKVLNAAETTSGPVSFAERYSNTTREAAQRGRRGALMLTLDVAHPDVESFVTMKQDLTKVTGANVSVRLSNEFMQAVVDDREYTHRWPIDSPNPVITKKSRARDLWEIIIKSARDTAEPGLIFWDRQHNYSTSSVYPEHKNSSTNPCSEIAMPPGDSCRLIAMNAYGFVENPFTPEARFNHAEFYRVVYESQRLMDDLVDLELEHVDRIREKVRNDPEPEYIKEIETRTWDLLYEMGKKARRTGLGFTALGDTMAALGYRFDSEEAMTEVEKIMRTKCKAEFESSIDMAVERGAFEGFNPVYEEQSEFVQMLKQEFPEIYGRMMRHGRRNISISTVAPNGTLSTQTQTTSGIEPAYEMEYDRNRKVGPGEEGVKVDRTDKMGDAWEKFHVVHHGFLEWQKITGKTRVEDSPYFGSTAPEIDWIRRVGLQGIVQKYTTHSISSTINLPKDVSEKEVANIYFAAWEQGLKGITVYRDTCRDGVLVKSESLENKVKLVQVSVKPHPVLDIKPQSLKYRVKRENNGDSLHVVLTSDLYVDDKTKKAYFIPTEDFQVRAPLGAATSVTFAQSGMDRTEILRGPDPDYAEQVVRLQSASSNEEEGIGPRRIKSIEHAVGLVFEDYLLRNGIVGRDELGKLANLVRKRDLRKVQRGSKEYDEIISQVRVGDSEREVEITGNHGRRDRQFECSSCGGKEYALEAGCSFPRCTNCGEFEGGSCG